mmetsp:Transcript_24667/g.44391  ORF Transcript_24667/g.44391 Transcript_24667/m.44391 type:complete len:108 (-) Transcript_24667:1108-1431(-)
MAHGLADNLLTSVVRAWDFKSRLPSLRKKKRSLLVAPAMNTAMWDHPVTEDQLATIRRWGVQVIPPVTKRLACGDVGVGAMASPEDIAAEVRRVLEDTTVAGGEQGR